VKATIVCKSDCHSKIVTVESCTFSRNFDMQTHNKQ